MDVSRTKIDSQRGRAAASLLHDTFVNTGIHGQKEMPEDTPPKNVTRGSLEHLLFTTLTVSIDYLRDADALWRSSRETFDDPESRYLFCPRSLHEAGYAKVRQDMKRHGLALRPDQDARIWHTVGVTFYKKWSGDPRNFLAACNWDAPTILHQFRTSKHPQNNRMVLDYPFLRGAKIGPLWLRMLRDNVGITELKGLEQVPIPVDIHVARATLCLGVVRGRYAGPLTDLFEQIRKAWFESVTGLTINGRPMIALDVDEALWHLSKYGCTNRGSTTERCPVYDRCEARTLCVSGTVHTQKNNVEMDT